MELFVHIMGQNHSFSVNMEPSNTVYDLKKVIHKENELDGIAPELTLYKVNLPDGEDIKERAFQVQREELKSASTRLSELFPNNPSEKTVSIVASVDARAPGSIGAWLHKTKSSYLDPYFTFVAPKRGDFGSMNFLPSSGIDESDESEELPEFVTKFKQSLLEKRIIKTPKNAATLESHLTKRIYDIHFTDASTEREILDGEHHSYVLAFESPVEKTLVEDAYDLGGEAYPHYLLMVPAVVCSAYLRPWALYSFGKSWNFPLIAEVRDGVTLNEYSYQPRSDFLLSVHDIPIMILEVCSDRQAYVHHECDRPRLLLQASCVIRLLDYLTDTPNIVLAAYIDKRLTVSCYFLFQVKGCVKYYVETFDLRDPLGIFKFLFQVYNFVSYTKKKIGGSKLKQDVNALFADLSKGLPGFTTKTTTKRRHDKDGDGEGGQGDAKRPRQENQTLNEPTVTQALAKKGYYVQLEEEIDGWRPRHQLKPTLSRAMFQGILVMLKLLDKGSTELKILQFFNEKKSSANHVIALLDVIHLDVGAVVALPIAYPLRWRGFTTPAIALDLMDQLVEAVDFIHTNGVAHLDLKPDNIVVSTSTDDGPRLAVIDFGVSVVVESPEDEVEGFVGTKDWVAPEVGAEDGPRQRYSAIRADRWACGKLLLHMAQDQPMSGRMTKLVKGLMSTDPLLRPSLGTYFTEARKATKRSSDNSPALAPKRQCQGLQTGRPDAILPDGITCEGSNIQTFKFNCAESG